MSTVLSYKELYKIKQLPTIIICDKEGQILDIGKLGGGLINTNLIKKIL
jgi:hypothetical protein